MKAPDEEDIIKKSRSVTRCFIIVSRSSFMWKWVTQISMPLSVS